MKELDKELISVVIAVKIQVRSDQQCILFFSMCIDFFFPNKDHNIYNYKDNKLNILKGIIEVFKKNI